MSMEWLLVFAAGAATGFLAWPLLWRSRSVPSNQVFRAATSRWRFAREFGIAPSRDPDIHDVLQPTVDKHLSYLREARGHASKDLGRLQSEPPRAVVDAGRAAAMLRRTKKRLTKVSKQLDEATALASEWGFRVEAPLRAVPSEVAVPQTIAATRPARRRRTPVAAGASHDGTPAAG
jgi:hypothetical protein